MRIFRTADGRHVPDGHPDAAFLAFREWDDVPAEVVKEIKALTAPANKQGRKPANKER